MRADTLVRRGGLASRAHVCEEVAELWPERNKMVWISRIAVLGSREQGGSVLVKGPKLDCRELGVKWEVGEIWDG